MNVTVQKRANTITSLDGSRTISAEEFDRLFDEGSDEIDQFVDLSKGKWVEPAPKRVNVDFPAWMVQALDREAGHRGVPRQALIKMWLADRLDEISRKAPSKP